MLYVRCWWLHIRKPYIGRYICIMGRGLLVFIVSLRKFSAILWLLDFNVGWAGLHRWKADNYEIWRMCLGSKTFDMSIPAQVQDSGISCGLKSMTLTTIDHSCPLISQWYSMLKYSYILPMISENVYLIELINCWKFLNTFVDCL